MNSDGGGGSGSATAGDSAGGESSNAALQVSVAEAEAAEPQQAAVRAGPLKMGGDRDLVVVIWADSVVCLIFE